MGDARAHAARTAPLVYSAIDLSEAGLEPQVLRPCVVGSGILLRRPTTRSTSICCARPVRDGWRSTARRPRSTTVACAGGSGEWRGCTCGCSRGLRPAEPVVLVTTTVVRDTPPDRHFSAWSRPKPAPDPLPGPSVASGVIPTKGGRNGVLQPPPGRAPEGRWRSSPWKRCNHAPPRSRVREHPAPLGALRRDHRRTIPPAASQVREHPAPLGALRLPRKPARRVERRVREHPAPLGALRLAGSSPAGGTHHTSGTTPHFCVISSPPHGRTTVTSSKGSNRPGPSPLAATTHRGTFCAERDVLRTK